MPTAQEDIVDTLLGQHQQIKLLFAQVEATDGDHKQQLFQELVGLLAVHESVEQTLIHPVAEKELPDGDAVVSPRLAEEQEAKEALSRLYDLGVAHPDFNDELLALRDAVAAHAEAEELLEFAQLREVVDQERLTSMRSAMAVATGLASRPDNPDGTVDPAGGLLSGPPPAVFDRVRDALRDAGEAA